MTSGNRYSVTIGSKGTKKNEIRQEKLEFLALFRKYCYFLEVIGGWL